MQCAELETRIDELLDSGRSPDDDSAIVAHIGQCDDCRTRVAAYHSMLDGVDALPMPVVGERFVEQTLQRSNSVTPIDRRREVGGAWIAAAASLAIAASLLVAVGWWWWQIGDQDKSRQAPFVGVGEWAADPRGDSIRAEKLEFWHGNLPPEQVRAVCLSTGRNLAMLPETVRRVSESPATSRLTGSIRPVVHPMGVAWQALREALPFGDETSAEPGGDTGWIRPSSGPRFT